MPKRYDHLKLTERDITERTQGIPLSGSTFRAVADFTYDWESWHRPDGQLVWVNFAVERFTGYSPRECLEMPDYPLPMVVPEDRLVISNVQENAKQKGSENDVEFRILHRNGQIRTLAVSYQPIYDDQRHLGFRTSARDITERCELREQIQHYAQGLEQLVEERTSQLRKLEGQRTKMERWAALGQLSARVAHEVNNPLAGIQNAFELIKGDLQPEHRHYRLLALIDDEIERISSIMHQMGQLYRRSPQESSHFDLIETVEGVAILLKGVAARTNVRIDIDGLRSAGSIGVCLPEGEIKQVVYNLVINAIQASQAGQTVRIAVGGARSGTGSPKSKSHSGQVAANQVGSEVWLEVSDEGCGIDSAILPEIFDPFFSTKEDQGKSSMGLGLSVTRSLVESMNGRVEVESQVGKGSKFRVILPG